MRSSCQCRLRAWRLVAALLAAGFVSAACEANGVPEAALTPAADGTGAVTATAEPNAPPITPPAGPVLLNHIQVVGTHNSYHVEPSEAILAIVRQHVPQLAATLQYTHLPLAKQFETQAVRSAEIDVYADPEGGLFANAAGRRVAGLPNPLSPDLLAPGFKVLHIQDIDVDSTCFTFVVCLRDIKSWSDLHRGHVPIIVLVEAKSASIPDLLGLGFVTPHPIGAAELDALDAEIRSVFGPDRLVTPDRVRGKRATLEEAVLKDGWPEVAAVRGRVMFVLINGGDIREAYRAGHPSLEGRVMFTSSQPGQPDAAFVKLDDAVKNAAAIRDLVAAGYIVRTRADADTFQARSGDTSMRDAALASGAQLVSTDYPVDDPRFAPHYAVSLGNGLAARCNPVLALAACNDSGLDLSR